MRAVRAAAEALLWVGVVQGVLWLLVYADLRAHRTDDALVLDVTREVPMAVAAVLLLSTALPAVVAWHLRMSVTRVAAVAAALASLVTWFLWRGEAAVPAYVALGTAVLLLAACLVPGAWRPVVPPVLTDVRWRRGLAMLAALLVLWPGAATVVGALDTGVAAPEDGVSAWWPLLLGLGWCAVCVSAVAHLLRTPPAVPEGAGDRPRVLVVEHEAACPPGRVGRWLTEAGLDVRVARPYRDAPVPPLAGHAGLVVLGGSMGANDDATVPWLGTVKDRVREAASAGVPTLGICLGHQLAAVAFGGTVERNPRGQQVGLVRTGWRPGAGDDRLLGAVAGARRGIHWNKDVVSALPADAVLLAATPEGDPQAVRFADTVWGVQLHPEADRAIVESWAAGDRADHLERGIDTDAALDAIGQASEELESAWRPLARRFADLVREAAARREVPA